MNTTVVANDTAVDIPDQTYETSDGTVTINEDESTNNGTYLSDTVVFDPVNNNVTAKGGDDVILYYITDPTRNVSSNGTATVYSTSDVEYKEVTVPTDIEANATFVDDGDSGLVNATLSWKNTTSGDTDTETETLQRDEAVAITNLGSNSTNLNDTTSVDDYFDGYSYDTATGSYTYEPEDAYSYDYSYGSSSYGGEVVLTSYDYAYSYTFYSYSYEEPV